LKPLTIAAGAMTAVAAARRSDSLTCKFLHG
jgi:hypothetical protein